MLILHGYNMKNIPLYYFRCWKHSYWRIQ